MTRLVDFAVIPSTNLQADRTLDRMHYINPALIISVRAVDGGIFEIFVGFSSTFYVLGSLLDVLQRLSG